MSDSENVVPLRLGAGSDSAEALVKKYAQNQQGLNDWAVDAVRRYSDVIQLRLADLPSVEESLRKEEERLREELAAASARFDLKPAQVWRVLRTHYEKSDVRIRALAEEFVTKYETELREANDRERLGEIDDEEDLELDQTGETEPESVKLRAKTKEWIEAIHKETERDERHIKVQLRAVMRDHPNIGEVPADPPGAQVWKQAYGRFLVTPRGVFAPVEAGLFDWERICKTPLASFAHSSMHLTDTDPRVHLNVLTYEGKNQREIEIPRGIISIKSVNAAIRALTHYNIYVVRTDFARSEIIEFLNFKPKGRKIVRAKITGWLKLEDGYHFVLPLVPPDLAPISPKLKGALVKRHSNAKPRLEVIVRLDKPIGSANRNYGFHVSGTVEEWQNKIAKPLEGCSNVALAVGTNLAASLVAFADEQTGLFHSWDPESSIGKTAGGTIGESVWGIPSSITIVSNDVEPFGAKWATASDVGTVALAQKRTDVGLNLDEIGSAKSIREKIIELAYILTGGTPKLRADSQGDLRQQSMFRTLGYSTGELSGRALFKELDDTEGRKKRFVDVPALVDERTALETVPHDKLGEFCGGIYANTARFHGAVGQTWLRYLVNLGEAEIKAKLEQHRRAWLALPEIVELLHRNPADDSVLRRFALVAAALRMAIEAGLWPWSIES